MSLTGLATFGIAQMVIPGSAPTATKEPPSSEGLEPTAPVVTHPSKTKNPTKTAEAPPSADLKIEVMTLPPGVPLADDKGLLEIDIESRDAIYVDDTFVGRGPMRRVPLDPGKHEVKLRRSSGEQRITVEVQRGKRSRVKDNKSP